MASVMLGDLDDFIAPGQACVNPLFTAPANPGAEKQAAGISVGGAKMQLVLEDDGIGAVDAMQVTVLGASGLLVICVSVGSWVPDCVFVGGQRVHVIVCVLADSSTVS